MRNGANGANKIMMLIKIIILGLKSICDWMQNWIFGYFWYCIFIFLRSDYNSYAISTCCDKSDGL